MLVIAAHAAFSAEPSKSSTNTTHRFEEHWGIPTYGLQSSVGFEKSTYLVGEQVKGKVILRNTGEQPKMLLKTFDITRSYRLAVIKDPKQMLRSIREEDRFDPGESGGQGFGQLRPNEIWSDDFELTMFFRIREAGKYFVTAYRFGVASDDGKSVEVPSGNAMFVVSAPPGGVVQSPNTVGDSKTNSFSENIGRSTLAPAPKVPSPRHAPTVPPPLNGTPIHSIPGETGVPSNLVKGALHGPAVPLVAEAGADGAKSLGVLGMLLLLSLGVIAFILLRARSRGATPKPPSGVRH